MKYTCTTTINQPIQRVVSLWDDVQCFAEWQDGFVSIALLSGKHNTKGAQSKILISGKHDIELLETIIEYNLPEVKKALYEHKHMTNTQTSRFVSMDSNKTQYISEVEYTQFNGMMIKLMAFLFPSKFKQQSQKWMDQFKDFCESQK